MSEGAAGWYPAPVLQPSQWQGVTRLVARCLELAHCGRLPTSLLVVGEPGQGREAFAVELAAGLVCRSALPQPCTCSACQRVRRGIHPDVQLLRPRSAAERRGEDSGDGEADGQSRRLISIEDVRQLVATLDHHPFEGRRRVVILDSVHTPPLGEDAAAALLKPMEEPPPQLIFLALAANPRHILPTILSRTVPVRIPPPTGEETALQLAVLACLTREEAQGRLAFTGGHLGSALALAGTNPAQLVSLVAAAVGGDGRALDLLVAQLKKEGNVVPLVAAIVETLRRGARADAEELVEAAAALLAAQRVAAVFHVPLERVAAGRLSALP